MLKKMILIKELMFKKNKNSQVIKNFSFRIKVSIKMIMMKRIQMNNLNKI